MSQCVFCVQTVIFQEQVPAVVVRGPGEPWHVLNLKTLHRNSIFTIENHLSLSKWPLQLLVASSTTGLT